MVCPVRPQADSLLRAARHASILMPQRSSTRHFQADRHLRCTAPGLCLRRHEGDEEWPGMNRTYTFCLRRPEPSRAVSCCHSSVSLNWKPARSGLCCPLNVVFLPYLGPQSSRLPRDDGIRNDYSMRSDTPVSRLPSRARGCRLSHSNPRSW